MNTPKNPYATSLAHPTNPNVRILHTQDNATAIWFLHPFKPEWIDEMPMAVSMGKNRYSNIVRRCDYDEESRRGVCATYFGAGCQTNDSGWDVLCVWRASEEEFRLVMDLSQVLLAQSVGTQERGGFT